MQPDLNGPGGGCARPIAPASFIGTGRRLNAGDFARAAHMLGCAEAAVRAVVHVEARGSGFDNRNRPVILFEPHVFYRNLVTRDGDRVRPLPERAEATRLGLAWPRWRPGVYPASSDGRYAQLRAAMSVHVEAALKACSWGLAQILGENYAAAGFASVRAMVEAMRAGEGHQLDAMVAFIISNRLDRHLRAEDWTAFAAGYNGPRHAENDYAGKLSRAAWRFGAGRIADFDPLTDGLLSLGDRGEIVKALQLALQAAGLALNADGDFGPMTDQAVRAYQDRRGLVADGKVGPVTGRALGLAFFA